MREVVIIALLAYIGWKEYSSRQERENLMDIIISKDSDELSKIRFAKQTKIKVNAKRKPDDLMSIDDMDVDSKEFGKVIKEERG